MPVLVANANFVTQLVHICFGFAAANVFGRGIKAGLIGFPLGPNSAFAAAAASLLLASDF